MDIAEVEWLKRDPYLSLEGTKKNMLIRTEINRSTTREAHQSTHSMFAIGRLEVGNHIGSRSVDKGLRVVWRVLWRLRVPGISAVASSSGRLKSQPPIPAFAPKCNPQVPETRNWNTCIRERGKEKGGHNECLIQVGVRRRKKLHQALSNCVRAGMTTERTNKQGGRLRG